MSLSPSPSPPCDAFRIEDLRPRGLRRLVAAILERLLDQPQWWMGLLRTIWPIARLPFTRWRMVTRLEDVQEVLTQDRVFRVPFAPKSLELSPGPLFMLALNDGPEYRDQRRQLMRVFRLEDIATTIVPRSAQLSERILAGCGSRIDAVEELLTRVPTLICQEYYGLAVPDAKLFAHWTLAVSSYLFGPPFEARGHPSEPGVVAAGCLTGVIEQAIQAAKRGGDRSSTIVGRLVEMQERSGDGNPSDEMIRAELFGMVAGLIPTTTIASANILEMLLRRKQFKGDAEAAARAGNDDQLKRCLFETLRFKPINLGPFRECAAEYTIAAGSARAKKIPAGAMLLASTQSAMFDKRGVAKPRRFNSNRASHEYMLFGHGVHWCLGAFFAGALMTQMFRALLLRQGLQRAKGRRGRLQTIGGMPVHLFVEFR
jgi:cytochrome P450